MTEQRGLQAGATTDPEPAVGPGQIQDLDVTGDDADVITAGIVLGARGGGGFARLLLGSVSSSVAEHG